jgi:glycerol-3-phosphate O-acyltransferase
MTVTLPLWAVVLILVLAGLAALDRVLVPSVRWVLRRRMERAVARLNTRLQRPIEPFKLAARHDLIVRLAYDPAVTAAAAQHARATGIPPQVAFEEARAYAREIVPSFSATVYFGFAIRAARRISRAFYRVRVGKIDAALGDIDPEATVIFVMNHRSNMDYVLVTWLVAGRSAIAYAVGEWARVWPLSAMIRTTGAYFIRRTGSRNMLYRRVLARHVQMLTAEGTTQAIFPEGGLSLDGRVGPARLGLLSYVVEGFDAAGRDVVFVPVGLAYDRVLEDRVLLGAAASGGRRFRARPVAAMWFLLRLWMRSLRGRYDGLGTAAAGFGTPVSLRAHVAAGGNVTTLGDRLMDEIARVVPILPVPLAAAALLEGPVARVDLQARMQALADRLAAQGAVLKLPPQGMATAVDEGLAPLMERKAVAERDGALAVQDAALVGFYAASVRQRLDAATPQT